MTYNGAQKNTNIKRQVGGGEEQIQGLFFFFCFRQLYSNNPKEKMFFIITWIYGVDNEFEELNTRLVLLQNICVVGRETKLAFFLKL